jgi:hypothetical protein
MLQNVKKVLANPEPSTHGTKQACRGGPDDVRSVPLGHATTFAAARWRRELLVFGAPCQLRWLAGQEHGRTIPLTDIP